LFKNALVLCTGNICRSPMMEGLFRARMRAGSGMQVSSAGIAALVDHPADPFAVEVMQSHGLDITAHRARQLDEATLYNADLVIVMERSHLEWIDANYPAARGRVYLAGHWGQDKKKEVADPYMMPAAAFSKTYEQLSACVDDWLRKLRLARQ
jgi:protein-tyrosine phosphatase